MKRFAFLVYGTVCYALFFVTFLYTIGFMTNLVVPKSIDSGDAASFGSAVAIDLVLLSLFAIQHSGMARPGFKRAWTRIVPEPIERATYVLASTLVLIAVIAFWQPIAGQPLWHFDSGIGYVVGIMGTVAGFGLVLFSTMLIDHFELFGLRQVVDTMRRKPERGDRFTTPSLYRFVRHPLYVGWFVALWATPSMTPSHLVFAAVTSAYIVIAVRWEERDLVSVFGNRYAAYQASTPMFLPKLSRAARGRNTPASARVG